MGLKGGTPGSKWQAERESEALTDRESPRIRQALDLNVRPDRTPAPAQAEARDVLEALADWMEATEVVETLRHYRRSELTQEQRQTYSDAVLKVSDSWSRFTSTTPGHLRLLAQQPAAQAPALAGLWLGDKDGLSAAGLAHALTLLPKKRRAQEAEVFCNGEPVTGVSILGKHGQSMGEFQVYLQTEGQPRSATDIQIYPALAAAEAGEAEGL